MNIRFIDRPVKLPLQDYGEATEFIAEKFSGIPAVKTIYRFGNITTPGISDLDLLFVFNDNVSCYLTGFEDIPDRYRKVFTHGIMAMKESHFHPNQYFTLWSKHSVISGPALTSVSKLRTPQEEQLLKNQTAVEFLCANYIDLKVQMEYGTIKLRALLQHMKGIAYDLEYLGVTDSELHPLLKILKEWIGNWFQVSPNDHEISKWLLDWIPAYDRFTLETMQKIPMYLPKAESYKIARNQRLEHSSELNYQRKGTLLPGFLSVIGRPYFKIQNKLNQFQFGMPLTNQAENVILVDRFHFLKEMKAYNRVHLPGFMTMTTSVTSKLI